MTNTEGERIYSSVEHFLEPTSGLMRMGGEDVFDGAWLKKTFGNCGLPKSDLLSNFTISSPFFRPWRMWRSFLSCPVTRKPVKRYHLRDTDSQFARISSDTAPA